MPSGNQAQAPKPPKSYHLAENVEQMAKKIIRTFHPELMTAEIAYLFVSEASKKNGRPVLGKVQKVSGVWSFFTEMDFVITIALPCWNDLNEARRQALVDHLLERCTGEEDEESGEMKWGTREPDVQEFTRILQRHGAWTDELSGMISVAQQINVDERLQEVTADTSALDSALSQE